MNILDFFNISKLSFLDYPYMIAEAGVNHEGDMELAKRLIREAKEGGADAIKFQTYKAETIASKNSPSYWDLSKESTTSQFELFKKYDKFWKKEFEELKKYCDEVGIEFLSTPFDEASAYFLNDLMPVFKISSSDITNKPFIELMASFGKPIILSTGASSLDEIKQAKSWIDKYSLPLSLLHCVLNYPTENENANLGRILGLKEGFPENVIGYSDHTLPGNMMNLIYSYLLGARIIEKHFTHDKSLPGNDHYHAMDKDDLKEFYSKLEKFTELFGSRKVDFLESEKLSRENARRSLVAKVDIQKGEKICAEMLTYKRPASGISPSKIDEVINSISNREIKSDEIIEWNMIDK